jgi:hypothetical protein
LWVPHHPLHAAALRESQFRVSSEYAAPVQDGGSSRAFKRWGGVTRQASLIGDNPEKNSNASLFLTAIAALISEDSEVLAWR